MERVTKNNMEELFTNDLEKLINSLLEAKKNQVFISGEFAGHYFDSQTVDMDQAFLEVYGMSKREYQTFLLKEYRLYLQSLAKMKNNASTEVELSNLFSDEKHR